MFAQLVICLILLLLGNVQADANCKYGNIVNAPYEILELSSLKGKIFSVNISPSMSLRYSVCENGLKYVDKQDPKNNKDVQSIVTINGTDYYTSVWLNGEEIPDFMTENGFNTELYQFFYGNGQEISNRKYLGQEIQWICDPNADDITLTGFVSTGNFYGLNITSKHSCTYCKWYLAPNSYEDILDLTSLRNETIYFTQDNADYTYSICQNRFNVSSGQEQMIYQEDDTNKYTQIWCRFEPFYYPTKSDTNGISWTFQYQHGQRCANATIEPNDCWIHWRCNSTASKTSITSIAPGPDGCDIVVNISSPMACPVNL